jgi:hypothetical protein
MDVQTTGLPSDLEMNWVLDWKIEICNVAVVFGSESILGGYRDVKQNGHRFDCLKIL